MPDVILFPNTSKHAGKLNIISHTPTSAPSSSNGLQLCNPKENLSTVEYRTELLVPVTTKTDILAKILPKGDAGLLR